MTDDELTRAYDALRRQRQARPAAAPPSLEAVQSLAENRTPTADREALLERVLESGASDELALLQSVASGATDSGVTNTGASKSWTRWWPAAAAAVVVLSVGLPMARRSGNAPTGTTSVAATPEEPRFRGGASTAAPAPLVPASDAVLPSGQRFVWTSVADATQYDVELVDADGQPVATFASTDTTTPLPADLADTARARARGWTVTALLRDGRRQRSALRLLRAP